MIHTLLSTDPVLMIWIAPVTGEELARRAEIAELEKYHKKLAVEYGPDHPVAKRVEARVIERLSGSDAERTSESEAVAVA